MQCAVKQVKQQLFESCGTRICGCEMIVSLYLAGNVLFQIQDMLQQMQDKFQATSNQMFSRNILLTDIILYTIHNPQHKDACYIRTLAFKEQALLIT